MAVDFPLPTFAARSFPNRNISNTTNAESEEPFNGIKDPRLIPGKKKPPNTLRYRGLRAISTWLVDSIPVSHSK